MSINNNIVIHLIVVGFHHKKGCDIEYSYPSLGAHLPSVWRPLPSLALPDGAHHYDRFSIYFHLPDRDDHRTTIFGVSCYRQMDADKLLNRDSSVTRGTVQKSVVVLSRVPLYGIIEAKLEMITHAYFKELDFRKVSLLEETFHNLNTQLSYDDINNSQAFVGLSSRQLVMSFRHQIVLLFKLLLLEKRVLIYAQKSPVKDVCVTLLSLCSLIPGMVEYGLSHSSLSVHPNLERQTSNELQLSPGIDHSICGKSVLKCHDTPQVKCDNICDSVDDDEKLIKEIDDALSNGESDDSLKVLKLSLDDCGFPLELFTCGSFCHPYLSISYLDILEDVRIRSSLIGATNFLFKQKRELFDVIVDLDSAKIDIFDSDLRKKLSLTMEDLRFADYIVKNVISENGSDVFLDGTNWEGSDAWIRCQFKVYLLHMLRTSQSDESSRECSSFNPLFMSSLKETHHHKVWSSLSHSGVFQVTIGHPFSKSLALNDMRLRLAQAFASDQSKKLNQTVLRTSKAVENAVSTAKSTVSLWWSNHWSAPKNDKNDSDASDILDARSEAETQL